MVTFTPEKLLISGENTDMFKRLKELYKAYKPYVRVDLIMYAALILMIFLYFIVSVLIE
jgi:hypothetical protein